MSLYRKTVSGQDWDWPDPKLKKHVPYHPHKKVLKIWDFDIFDIRKKFKYLKFLYFIITLLKREWKGFDIHRFYRDCRCGCRFETGCISQNRNWNSIILQNFTADLHDLLLVIFYIARNNTCLYYYVPVYIVPVAQSPQDEESVDGPFLPM